LIGHLFITDKYNHFLNLFFVLEYIWFVIISMITYVAEIDILKLRIKVIINPSSGRQNSREFVEDVVTHLLDLGKLARVDMMFTQKGGDAETFASETPSGDYDLVLAVGGDGTVNEVVNGMLKAKVDLPLAIYAGGTVNDFATFMNLPSDPFSFAEMLIAFQTANVDVGLAKDRYFLNVLAGGLMTDIAYKVPSDAKATLGRIAYWLEGAKDLTTNTLSSFPIRVESKEESFEFNASLFIVSNSKSVGGIRKLLPYAELCDGLLDVLVVSKLAVADILPLLGQLLTGNHLKNDNVIYFQTSELKIFNQSESLLRLDLDGEAGPNLPISIKNIPHALRIIVPSQLAPIQNCPVNPKEIHS